MNESVNSIQSLYATKQYAVLVAAVLMMLAQAAGCVGEDSGSDAGYDGGGGLDGGSVDASASGSIGGDSCNYPSCLANLVTTCVPSGTWLNRPVVRLSQRTIAIQTVSR